MGTGLARDTRAKRLSLEIDSLVEIEDVEGLFGYAMVLTRDRTLAEDLVQETYVRALGAIDRLWENSNIKGWLFAILRNLWFNELRKRRFTSRVVELESDPILSENVPCPQLDPFALYVKEREAAMVRTAVARLPVSAREILVLREYDTLSYQEIAARLDCPIGTVMSRLGRARARLRNELEASQFSNLS